MDSAAEKRKVFIRRYLWRVAFFALAALIFSWITTHAVKTTYKAETEIAFKSTEIPVRFELLKLFSNPLPIFLEDDIYSITYDIPSILASDKITQLVIEKGNLKERLYDPKEFPVYQDWFDYFHAHLMFDIHPDTQTLTLAYAARTPELAREITQLYSDVFEDYFVHQYWRYSVADAVAKVVEERSEQLAKVETTVSEILVGRDKIAVKRGAAEDVTEYLFAEGQRMLSQAKVRGYDLAIERVQKEMASAQRGGKVQLIEEALLDPVLVFAKAVYAQGSAKLVGLEHEYTGEYPEVKFWKKMLPIIEGLVKDYSIGAVQTSINTLNMRSLDSRAKLEYWNEVVGKLRIKVERLPQFEEDVYGLMRTKTLLEEALWFWERRLEYHRMGEQLIDHPFITLDGPIVPERAYYPILNTWVYAFPVLLIVGTLWFLMRCKLEDECIEDIQGGRL